MTTTMVCFRAAGTAYCLPVEAARSVRSADGLVHLPEPADEVAGILPGDPPLTVLAALGGRGDRIVVLEAGSTTFGLLVDTVTGVRRVHEAQIGIAPPGQRRPVVAGTLYLDGELVLVADAAGLAAMLHSEQGRRQAARQRARDERSREEDGP